MDSTTATGWAVAVLVVVVFNVAVYWANENSFLFRLCGKCCRLPSSFHATRTASGQRSLPRPEAYWAWDALTPSDVVTSAWVPTPVLLVWRWGLLAYAIITLVVEGSVDKDYHSEWLIYFTHWALLGMAVQGMVGGIVTAIYVRKKPEDILWNFGIKAMLLLDQTIPTCSLFLAVFYWSVLYSGNNDAANVMKHGISAAAMMCTFLLSQTPYVSYHFQAPVLLVTVYCVFMWIYAAATDSWSYEALNTSAELSGVYYIVVPTLLLLCFYAWFLLAMLRDFVIFKMCKVEAYHSLEPTAVAGAVITSAPAPAAADKGKDEEQGEGS
eukprot:jgi/Tetstr1/426370/TSEL_016682.t1